MNHVALTGATTGAHKLFIVYGDYSVNPGYTTLYDIIASFKMK